MIEITQQLHFAELANKMLIVLFCFIIIFIACIIDLIFGRWRTKKLKQKLHSKGLRLTLDKLITYLLALLLSFLPDCIGNLFEFYTLPFATLLITISVLVIETISVFESLKAMKNSAYKLLDIASEIVKCDKKEDALKLIKTINELAQKK